MAFDASWVFDFSTEVLFESKSRPLNYNMTFPLMNAMYTIGLSHLVGKMYVQLLFFFLFSQD